jgi:gas vesicle protein
MRRKKENTGKKIALGAAVAGVVGYLGGILTAPKSGRSRRSGA